MGDRLTAHQRTVTVPVVSTPGVACRGRSVPPAALSFSLRSAAPSVSDPPHVRPAGPDPALCPQTPAAVADVTLLVRELRRVTLLWDELWAGALSQQQPEASRRLTALAAELQKVADRETLSEQERADIAADKYSIALRPVRAAEANWWSEVSLLVFDHHHHHHVY